MPSSKRIKKIRCKFRRRRHDKEGIESTTVPTQQDSESFQSDILNMQNVVGNQAVIQMTQQGDIEQSKAMSSPFNPSSFKIQRLPKVDDAQSEIDQPKAKPTTLQASSFAMTSKKSLQRMPTADAAIFQSSPNIKKTKFGTAYQRIINDIRTLDGIYDNTAIGNSVDTAKAGFQAVLAQLAVIEGDINTYLEGQEKKGKGKNIFKKKSATRDHYAGILLGEIMQDRRTIAQTMLFVATSDAGTMIAVQDMPIRAFMKAMGFGGIGTLSDSDAQRGDDGEIKKVGGGTNQLTVMNQGFFNNTFAKIEPS
jgi:hypothetical protein